MKRKVCELFFILVCVVALPACATPVTYSAEAIEAWVIDADTKRPLEGVVVVAHWVLEGGIHVDRVGELVILETVTDKNGRFYFSGWGPIRHWKRSRLTNMDPELLIFKSSYAYQRLANPSTKEAIEGKPYPVRRSVWNGKTIELKSFKGTQEEYARHLSSLDIYLRFAYDNENCEMKQVPRMVVALHHEEKRFREAKVYSSLTSLNRYLAADYKDKCSIKELLKEYLQ